ncbi:MAG: hypothetical protein JHC87_03290 [Thermoleophilaceae bacterium]|nr:hypothetical protein [Thermoleophilaceae bacterium]
MSEEQRNSGRNVRGGRDRAAEGLGGLIDELASNLPLGDALSKIVGSSERMTKAQQAAYSAVGLSSVSEVERLTLRVRSMFHRIDELEDEMDRMDRRIRSLEAAAAKPAATEAAPKKPRSTKPKAPSARKSA